MTAAWFSEGQLPDRLKPVDKVVPVLGAGTGRDAGLPTSKDLANYLANEGELRADLPDRENLFSVVAALTAEGWDRDRVQESVAGHIRGLPLQPTAFLDRLVGLQSGLIFTFNYDDLIATAGTQAGLTVTRLVPYDREHAEKALQIADGLPVPNGELVVVHLHGHVDDPKSIVLDHSSYRQTRRSQDHRDLVATVARSGVLLFVGTQLDEPYVVGILEQLPVATSQVLVCHDSEIAALTQGRGALRPDGDVHVVGYPDHTNLLDVADWLQPPAAEQPAGPPPADGSPEPAALAEDDHIPVEIRRRGEDGQPPAEDTGWLSLIAQRRRESVLSEQDLLAASRLVVVGAPGTGKSYLLERLSRLPAPVLAVRVRLAEIHVGPGTPDVILAGWARHALGDAAPNVTGVQEGRIRFLLDGLDEIAPDRQEAACQVIAGLVAALPQHDYVVASRPVPALRSLGVGLAADAGGPWTVVDLVASSRWRDRYLAREGLDVGELIGAVPALRDGVELLNVPFFLVQAVALYRQGGFGEMRDVGELLAEFVESALRKEEEQLASINLDVARDWLRRTALHASLRGHRSLTFDELPSLPDGGTVGDVRQLVEQLQLRLLLHEEEGRVRFAHRLLADELTAQALDLTEPGDAILDAIAPQAGPQLSGVRDDLALPVGLLCLRSERWREAIAERDPMAAARGVPNDAPADRRTAAIELLWRTYERWRVWMWDYDMPALVEDAEVVGRLLRAEPPDSPHLAELRRLLWTGDPQQQGNAIRVFARAPYPGFTCDLQAILRDPARDGVVIRQAAIAAELIGAAELIDDLVDVAVATTDSPVNQDLVMVVRNLVDDDQLLEVAIKLAGAAQGGWPYVDMLRERLPARDRIIYARELGRADEDLYQSDAEVLVHAVEDLDEADVDDEVAENLAHAAALWDVCDDKTGRLLLARPEATARGVLAALADGAEWWRVSATAEFADPAVLSQANADAHVIQTAERAQDRRNNPPAAPPQPPPARPARQDPPPLRLRELLADPAEPARDELFSQAHHLSGQIKRLDDTEQEALAEIVAASWPDTPFDGLIIEVGSSSYRLLGPAAAWVFYGPLLDLPLNDDQWVQLALTSRVFGTVFTDWLSGHATEDRILAAARQTSSSHLAVWSRLLACAGDPLPPGLIAECAAKVTSGDAEDRELEDLLSKLVASGITQPVIDLAARDPRFGHVLLPFQARAGDQNAQQQLLAGLRAEVLAGRTPDRADITWLGSVSGEWALDDLFAILRAAYVNRTPADDANANPAGWYHRDVINPALETIGRVGGVRAVELFDELLAEGGDVRWLRFSRDAVAAAVLREQGQADAAAAIESLDQR